MHFDPFLVFYYCIINHNIHWQYSPIDAISNENKQADVYEHEMKKMRKDHKQTIRLLISTSENAVITAWDLRNYTTMPIMHAHTGQTRK